MKTHLKENTKLTIPGQKISVPVYIGNDIFPGIKSLIPMENFSRVAILMDKNVAYHWGEHIRKVFGKKAFYIVIPAGEEHKELSTLEKLLTSMLSHGLDRKSLLVNVGGGVVCDMGGLAAGIYMRGISFINIPTTLLAQTDAAIGGKTGINFGGLKNIVGSFSFPLAVFCDTLLLSTLPEREFRSGFAEIIKHALIYDKNLLTVLTDTDLGTMDEEQLADILSRSCKIKCEIVSGDVYDKGIRKSLNFGHTVGHAIEMLSYDTANPLLHGEAISIGMVAEARLSLLAGLISTDEFAIIKKLLSKANLPLKVEKSYKKKILVKMTGDKKNVQNTIKWVLLDGLCKTKIDLEQPGSHIHKAITYILA